MQWIVLGAMGALLLLKALQEQGWKTNCPRNPVLIRTLPPMPGVYILRFSKIKDAIIIGAASNLRDELYHLYQSRPGWDTFDWRKTTDNTQAQRIAEQLRSKVEQRSGVAQR